MVEPSRPFSDFVVELFGLADDSVPARLTQSIIEPLMQIVLITVIAWVSVRLVRRFSRKAIDRSKRRAPGAPGTERTLTDGETARPVSTRRAQRAEALGAVVSSVLSVIIWAVAILVMLATTFGISLAPFLAGAGILGVALGFGAQDLVKDFISGMFMLVEDQYGVGDVVDVGEATGLVEGVSLRTTRLRDVTGTLWHVPNGEIRRVGNMSQEWSRALLDVAVAYDTDVDAASELIKSAADEMAAEPDYRSVFLAAPEVWGIEELAADAILLRLVIKTQPGEQWAIARELRRRIKLALDSASIEIPFPQRTVWIRDAGSPEPASSLDASTVSPAATGMGAPEEGPVPAAQGAGGWTTHG